MFDTIIKGGSVVDGQGGRPFTADIGVKDGRIAEIGRLSTPAAEVIDADGLTVTPGFVDLHTHYDGQIMWDDVLEPSFSHGVTTAIMGSCGVGFAPVRKGEESVLIEIMQGTEDVPGDVLRAGVDFRWQTFPEYMDVLAERRLGMDVGAVLPHAALRPYVMGERGVHNEKATTADLEALSRLVEEGLKAGALGVSTSRIHQHQATWGECIPGTFAELEELLALARGLRGAGRGVYQVVPMGFVGSIGGDTSGEEVRTRELDFAIEVQKASGRPVIFTVLEFPEDLESWRRQVSRIKSEADRGVDIYAQVSTGAGQYIHGLQGYHLFERRPSYRKLADLPLAERAAEMRRPEVRAAILSEADLPPDGPHLMDNQIDLIRSFFDLTYPLREPIVFEPDPDQSLLRLARSRGAAVEEILYDIYTERDGTSFAVAATDNYARGNLDVAYEMLRHPRTRIGLGDGGAHVRVICAASYPTFNLQGWTRDRVRGPKIPIEFIVKKQSADNARLFGLDDRGTLEIGKRADINVIDMNRLRVGLPRMVQDFPAGGRRLIQGATGYAATLVNGVATRRDDEDTGARPGRVVRRPS
ncbi:MAG: amidohydrolase family protein [Caulobacteraceae bacterium]|nr:amidohydrolase family protein [Caulobacteraceae bacterium]